jgi:hypothetical protein
VGQVKNDAWYVSREETQNLNQAPSVREQKQSKVLSAEEEYIPVEEFAKFKGITPEKAIQMIRDGFYQGRVIDEKWYVSYSEIGNNKINGRNNRTKELEVNNQAVTNIHKVRWAFLFGCFAFFHAFFTDFNFGWSLGYVASFFLVGVAVSALIWIFKRQWNWYNWLNFGSYIGVALFFTNMILTPILKDYIHV